MENTGLLSVDNGESKIIEAEGSLIAQEYYTDYAKYVLEYRALPSVYDGLKPVQRRIIHIANQQPKKLMKTAKLAGLCMALHPHGSCLSGDTVFYMLNGSPMTIKEMYDSNNSKFYGMAINESNQLEPCEITNVRVGQVTRKLYHINLSDGSLIKCTGNHPFMSDDFKFINAENLEVGQKLLSGYWNNGNRIKTSHDKGQSKLIYHKVSEKYYNWTQESELHIHHIDMNPYNNIPENLQLMTNSDHRKLHYELTPEIYDSGLELGRQSMFNEEGYLREDTRKKNSNLMKIYNSSQGLRRAIYAINILKKRNIDITEDNYESLRGEIYNLPIISRLISKGYINEFSDLIDIELKNIGCIYRENKSDDRKDIKLNRKSFKRTYDGKVAKRDLEIISIEIETLDEDYITYDFTSDVNSNAIILTSVCEDYSKFIVTHNSSIEGALYNMAYPLNNLPLFTTKGNFGGVNATGASSRYTECYLSEIARMNFCQFIDYADYEVGEIGEMEPKSLPSLIPYALFDGAEGIAIGLSTKIMPLNLIDLIDYYIDYIKRGESSIVVKPDIGHSLIENEDIYSLVSDYKSRLTTSSIVTQISDNSFLIEGLYGKSIDSVIKKIDKWTRVFTNDQAGFRDASTTSMKYIFELYDDKDISPEEFCKVITEATRSNTSFNRVMEEDGSAVYAELDYVVKQSLKCLNKAIDKKIEYDLNKNIKQLELYGVLRRCKELGVFNNITKITSEELVHKIITSTDCSEDIAKEVVKKPISYLTKSHDIEEEDLRSQIEILKNHDRKKYLINLYKEFKKAVLPIYEDKKHSILINDRLENPCIKIDEEGQVNITDGDGQYFTSVVYFISDKGYIYKRTVSALLSSEFYVDTSNNDKITGLVTDNNKYVSITTSYKDDKNWEGRLILDLLLVYDGKKIINLRDTEVIKNVEGISRLSDNNSKYLKSRLSKSVYVKK